jgi:hypothetical protein
MHEESNKAVLVGWRMAFAYTGIDTLDGQPTDVWLASAAGHGSTRDLAEAVERIRVRAGLAIRRRYIAPMQRRLAFVGVGWSTPGPVEELSPLLCVISNALDENGDWLPEGSREFRTQVNIWGKERGAFLIFAGGQSLTPRERSAIWRHLRVCVRARRGHEVIIRGLVDAMAFVADRYATVGRSLQVVVLPRRAAEIFSETGRGLLLTGGVGDDHNSFFYLTPGEPMVSFGPHVAANGTVMLSPTVHWGVSAPPSEGDVSGGGG